MPPSRRRCAGLTVTDRPRCFCVRGGERGFARENDSCRTPKSCIFGDYLETALGRGRGFVGVLVCVCRDGKWLRAAGQAASLADEGKRLQNVFRERFICHLLPFVAEHEKNSSEQLLGTIRREDGWVGLC